MHTHLVLGSMFLSRGLAAVVAPAHTLSTSPSLITPGPQIELLRKQNDARFMGYLDFSSSWVPVSCNAGNTLHQRGSYWGCCPTTRDGCASTAIGCVGGNMIFSVVTTPGQSISNSLFTRACSAIWTASSDVSYTVCNTGLMFENQLDNSPHTQIFCGLAPSNWTYLRQLPATIPTTSSTSPSATPSPNPASSAPTVTPTSTSPPTITSPSAVPEEKKESKAWIAGAIVGALAGLALIGLGIFFFMRRKKNKSNVAPATGSVGPTGSSAYQQNTYSSGPNSPPQYYPPPMQQNAIAPGFVPVGVSKQDSYYSPQSPTPQGSPPQQWQQPGGQLGYGGPSPNMTPQQLHAQPAEQAQYMARESRAFSSELEGSHGQPEIISSQPKK